LQEDLRNAPSVGYEMTQRIVMVDDATLHEKLVLAALRKLTKRVRDE
jgi:hypothetical protein